MGYGAAVYGQAENGQVYVKKFDFHDLKSYIFMTTTEFMLPVCMSRYVFISFVIFL